MGGASETTPRIVLASHNGEQHIREQLDSIQQQSLQKWVLLVRDDGSSDATRRLIAEYSAADSRIRVLPPSPQAGGIISGMNALLAAALADGAEFIFFADQDDVWLPEKLQSGWNRLQEMERKYGVGVPLLVHHDLEVVDDPLEPVAPSLHRYMRIDPKTKRPECVLPVQNLVTGCSMAINRALLQLALPIPPQAVMHDWWLALLAASAGRIGYIEQPLARYRQHTGNVIGAQSYWQRFNPAQSGLGATLRRGRREFIATVLQAEAAAERLSRRGTAGSADTLTRYLGALDRSRVTRLLALWRTGVLPQTLLRRLYFLFQAISPDGAGQ